ALPEVEDLVGDLPDRLTSLEGLDVAPQRRIVQRPDDAVDAGSELLGRYARGRVVDHRQQHARGEHREAAREAIDHGAPAWSGRTRQPGRAHARATVSRHFRISRRGEGPP